MPSPQLLAELEQGAAAGSVRGERMSGERGAADIRLVADIAATIEEETSLGWDTDIVARVVYERHVAALLDEVVEVLESVEWGDFDGHENRCPECDGHEKHGHRSDCRLSALLSRLKREEASDG